MPIAKKRFIHKNTDKNTEFHHHEPVLHLIRSIQYRNPEHLELLFREAEQLEDLDKANALPRPLAGKIIATLFFEPSTRTRFSFEAAIQKLGGSLLTAENAAGNSSAVKGETLEDTIRTVNGYADAIVMRHFEEGAAERAAAVSNVPIINAGDGAGEHPTQALLDLYTIKKEIGRIDNFTIALIGDLVYGRTVHSLLPLFAERDNAKINLVSPDALKLPEQYRRMLEKKNVSFREFRALGPAIRSADVLYVTRVQKERFKNPGDYEKVKDSYVINKKVLSAIKKTAVILHPLPRVNEIAPEVDADIRAAYFRQVRNGLYVRMALLSLILGSKN